jgi:hypothetical protein
MIPADQTVPVSGRAELASHLAAEMAACLGRERLDHGERQVADAVAAFWLAHYPGRSLTSDFVRLLVGRALCAAGHGEVARMWLGADERDARPETLLKALAAADCATPTLASISSQLIMPAELHCATGGMAWTLDCGHLVLGDAAELEMLCMQVLRSLLRHVSVLWDGSSGRGALALKGVDALARRVLGEGTTRKETDAFRSGVEDLCAAALAGASRDRGWSSVPAVVRVD